MINGTVEVVTPAAIEVGDGTTRTSLATVDVSRIELEDSVKNGVVKGAIIGALVGSFLVVGGTAVDATARVYSGNGDFSTVGEGTESAFYTTVAIGALLGYVIDVGKVRTLYDREAGGLSVAVRPIVSKAGKGVGINVRW
jgi:hypothetical protein